ncbi:MAG TPA: hypothetical protein VMA74_03020 [Dyella sp.]|uniref:hypothetical protein n=1 Tax=Dyella sp. TaxID=1869338 RepID=UPI002C5662CE|nr:hypothetical protein [Dyella sp.]HUB88678.1 hypothetical protein [Dyella sp.]
MLIGSQNTEKPYAMPMHKWMAKAAGGTNQRLKRGPAMVRSLAKKPDAVPPDADTDSGTAVMFVSQASIETICRDNDEPTLAQIHAENDYKRESKAMIAAAQHIPSSTREKF